MARDNTDQDTGDSQIWFMGGSGGTTIISWAGIVDNIPWRFRATADFNRDAEGDLLIQDPVSGAASYWLLSAQAGPGWFSIGPSISGLSLSIDGVPVV